LAGAEREVVFNEGHLGVSVSPGIMTLVRQYRLHWCLAALGVVAALFVWRNAVSLAPRREAPAREESRGQDSTAGLVNLLRRSIPAGQVLAVGFEEWQRSRPAVKPDKLRRVREEVEREAARPPLQRDPVQAYGRICAILAERK